MSPERPPTHAYRAREGYAEDADAERYEEQRFAGVLGRYRRARELGAVETLLERLPRGVTIADCPCGNGRWWPVLAQRAGRILAFDLSEAMVRYARERAAHSEVEVEVQVGDAESLPLADGAVDYTFSFALTKHLPVSVQCQVLLEFGRVSRAGVLSTFPVLSHFTYEVWRRRGAADTFPLLPEQLERMAAAAGLEVQAMRKCTTPIGVERVVLFSKLA